MNNLNKIKSVYDAFAKGDIFSVLEVLSSGIDWTEAEGFPYGGSSGADRVDAAIGFDYRGWWSHQ